MLGNPKFDYEQTVHFKIDNKDKIGVIWVVDSFGTWDYDKDVCYDIFVESENVLYKHIPEYFVRL